MFRYWILGKSIAAALLATGLLSPAAAQSPAQPLLPPDLAWHGALPLEAQPRSRPPTPAATAAPCGDALCRARLVGELWKKGGVALDVTPWRW
jgi:hypothetical protein